MLVVTSFEGIQIYILLSGRLFSLPKASIAVKKFLLNGAINYFISFPCFRVCGVKTSFEGYTDFSFC